MKSISLSRLDLGRRTDLVGDFLEGSFRVRTDRLDSGQADDDDQSEHNGVFNSRRTVFRNQKTLNFLHELLHRDLSEFK